MHDLKYVFAYLRPCRRQVAAAVGLVFVECIFEMSIPMLMTGLVDVGVANRDVPYMLGQGGKMVLCALLALVTDLPLEVPGVPTLPLGDAEGAAALLIRYVKEGKARE